MLMRLGAPCQSRKVLVSTQVVVGNGKRKGQQAASAAATAAPSRALLTGESTRRNKFTTAPIGKPSPAPQDRAGHDAQRADARNCEAGRR